MLVRFQEIVPLNAGNVLGPEDSGPAGKWLSLIGEALNSNEFEFDHKYDMEPESKSKSKSRSSFSHEGYCLASSKQMVGICLCVWIRTHLYQHLTNLKVSCVGRGIMSYLGNKVRYLI